MFLGPPAETDKDNISLSNENLNSQEQHLLNQHGKELCIFQLGLVKLCAFTLKEKKSMGDNSLGKTDSSKTCLPQSFREYLYITVVHLVSL